MMEKTRNRLCIVPIVALALGVLAPAAQTQSLDDVYPPLVPGGTVFGTEAWLHKVQAGEQDSWCQGRFLLRGTCEIHTTDKNVLGIAHWAQPLPTGNGTELSSSIEIRVYDLDSHGALVHTCGDTRTDDGSDPTLTVAQAVLYQTTATPGACGDTGGNQFFRFAPQHEGADANFRIEIDSDTMGWVQLFTFKS